MSDEPGVGYLHSYTGAIGANVNEEGFGNTGGRGQSTKGYSVVLVGTQASRGTPRTNITVYLCEGSPYGLIRCLVPRWLIGKLYNKTFKIQNSECWDLSFAYFCIKRVLTVKVQPYKVNGLQINLKTWLKRTEMVCARLLYRIV